MKLPAASSGVSSESHILFAAGGVEFNLERLNKSLWVVNPFLLFKGSLSGRQAF
jgi:hypothetical protein